ncbi:hypothetical protein [Mycoplasma sp. CSL7503-lung]|uniref:hypothetical protein n=1 Tax=Mycoplasma sp. CSL7503-lung TaxID=536372 RepID=UPI0021CF9CE7|nr:hypothetical protein [Mycoplasma sp. CSL7503-lung]MCU4706374.1 hypothetical protein [Mycoplasma sp. CSL7503-lung]
MEIKQASELFFKIITSIPGIHAIHELSNDEKITKDIDDDNLELIDRIFAYESTPNVFNFKLAITVLEGINVNSLNTDLYKRVQRAFKKNKISLDKLIIIVKGVK